MYHENVQLRILIQSYKKLCALIKVTRIYSMVQENGQEGEEILEIIRSIIVQLLNFRLGELNCQFYSIPRLVLSLIFL